MLVPGLILAGVSKRTTMTRRPRRSGLLKGLFKLALYTMIAVIAMGVVYPQLLENPGAIPDGVEQFRSVAQEGTTVDVEEFDVSRTERLVHHYVNQRRTDRGLNQLGFDPDLASIARAYSQDMAERNFFSHYSPEGNDFSDRYESAGYDCSLRRGDKMYKGGENLAKNYVGRPVSTADGRETYTTPDELAQAVVRGWMNSPEHRENMLKPVWRREGIGAYLQENGRIFVTQNFC